MPRSVQVPEHPLNFKVDANALAKARRSAGYTRAEFARIVGLAEHSYGLVERGHVGMSVDKLARAAHILGLSTDELIAATRAAR